MYSWECNRYTTVSALKVAIHGLHPSFTPLVRHQLPLDLSLGIRRTLCKAEICLSPQYRRERFKPARRLWFGESKEFGTQRWLEEYGAETVPTDRSLFSVFWADEDEGWLQSCPFLHT